MWSFILNPTVPEACPNSHARMARGFNKERLTITHLFGLPPATATTSCPSPIALAHCLLHPATAAASCLSPIASCYCHCFLPIANRPCHPLPLPPIDSQALLLTLYFPESVIFQVRSEMKSQLIKIKSMEQQ